MKPTTSMMAIAALSFFAFAQVANAQMAKDIQGVWKAVEVVVPSGPYTGTHTTDVQPSLFIFTKSHYSILSVGGFKPRPALKAAPSSFEEYAAVYGPFTANAGTYQVKGTNLTSTPSVAAWPALMSGGATPPLELEWKGADLWFISTAANGQVTRVRLTRVDD
ncbi:MAG TPA: hypothetical protein VGO52_23835 [Hyphomonadaceae bacterium]|jgi:hypothetical protein|nr:hypothetical protein [Hyphomonadaceae bacterium]